MLIEKDCLDTQERKKYVCVYVWKRESKRQREKGWVGGEKEFVLSFLLSGYPLLVHQNWIKQSCHCYLKKYLPNLKQHPAIMIYLPCMTLRQTCLMCWSVGARPWNKKERANLSHKEAFVRQQLTSLGKEPSDFKEIFVASTREKLRLRTLSQWSSPWLPPHFIPFWSWGMDTVEMEHRGWPHSPEDPGYQEGQWCPVLPARL